VSGVVHAVIDLDALASSGLPEALAAGLVSRHAAGDISEAGE
jgi:hypothetical protein